MKRKTMRKIWVTLMILVMTFSSITAFPSYANIGTGEAESSVEQTDVTTLDDSTLGSQETSGALPPENTEVPEDSTLGDTEVSVDPTLGDTGTAQNPDLGSEEVAADPVLNNTETPEGSAQEDSKSQNDAAQQPASLFGGPLGAPGSRGTKDQVQVRWHDSTINAAWSEGDSEHLVGKPTARGNFGRIYAKVTISAKNNNYNPEEYKFRIPRVLDAGNGAVFNLETANLPIPLAPDKNTKGWQYVLEDDYVVIQNADSLTAGGAEASFDISYNGNFNTALIQAGANFTLAITPDSASASKLEGDSCSMEFKTYLNLTNTTKRSEGYMSVFPNQTQYFGLTEADFDFNNYHYVRYSVAIGYSGSEAGTLTYTETPTLKSGDSLVAMSINPNSTDASVHKHFAANATSGTYVIDSFAANDNRVYVLVRHKKSNITAVSAATDLSTTEFAMFTDPETGQETFRFGSNTVKATLQSKVDPTNKQEKEATLAAPTYTPVPMGKPSWGGGGRWGKTPTNASNGAIKQFSAMRIFRSKDVFAGTFGVSGFFTEKGQDEGHGFVLGDEDLFAQSQDGTISNNTVYELTERDYYFSLVRVRVEDYEYDPTANDGSNWGLPTTNNRTGRKMINYDTNPEKATGTATVYYKTSKNGSWIQGPTLSAQDLVKKSGNTIVGTTVFDKVNDPDNYPAGGICAVKVVGKNFHYTTCIGVALNMYIRQNGPTFTRMINEATSPTVHDPNVSIQNSAYVQQTDKNGNPIRVNSFNDAGISDPDKYAELQDSLRASGILAKTGPNGEGSYQLLTTKDARHEYPDSFRLNGYLAQQGIPGYTQIMSGTTAAANNPAGEYGTYRQWVRAQQYYAITGENQDDMIAEGLAEGIEREEGVFYTLLPMGAEFDESAEVIGYGVLESQTTADVKVTTYPNYKGTGRMLVKFELSNVRKKDGTALVDGNKGSNRLTELNGNMVNNNYLATGFTVSYGIKVSWRNNYNATLERSLHVYQEATDIPLLGNHNGVSNATNDDSSAAGVANITNNFSFGETWPLSKLSGDFTEHTGTIYQVGVAAPLFSKMTYSGLTKLVSVDALNYVRSVETEVGEDYLYEIGYGNGETQPVKNVIFYDVLEDAKTGGEKNWKGVFSHVDTATLTARGIAPVVYYSTYTGFNSANSTFAYDLSDTDQAWTTTMPENKTTITAVAVDCSKTTSGADYSLPEGNDLVAYIHFDAPKDMDYRDAVNTVDSKKNGLAYNRAAVTILKSGETQPTLVTNTNYRTDIKLLDSRVQVDLIKKNDAARPVVVPGATFLLTGTKNWHGNGNQDYAIEAITIKSAESGDRDLNGVSCTVGKLYEVSTDVNGEVAYKNIKLYPGTYTLKETTAPTGYGLAADTYITVTETEDANNPGTYTYSVTVEKNNAQGAREELTKENGNSVIIDPKARTISGRVFVDKNKNGSFEAGEGERTLSRVTVKLTDMDGKPVKGTNGSNIADVTTNDLGEYTFENVSAGTYKVTVVYDGANYEVTTKPSASNANSNKAEDPDNTGKAVISNLNTTTGDLAGQNAGIVPKVEIQKYVKKAGGSELQPTQTAPLSLTNGDQVQFIIRVTNKATNDADVISTYTVKDEVDSKFAISSYTNNVGTATKSGQTITWSGFNLQRGVTELTIDATLNSDQGASMTNTAQGKISSESAFTDSNTVHMVCAAPIILGAENNNAITVSKVMTGKEPPKVDQTFQFLLAAVDGAPMPSGTGNRTSIALTNGALAATTATFGDIKYDREGTFEYKVTEIAGADTTHFEYDNSEYTVTVVVGKNTAGDELEIKSVTYKKGTTTEANAKFTNVYKYQASDAYTVPTVTKVVAIDNPSYTPDAQEFTFEITGDDPKSTANLPKDGTGATVSSVTVTTNTTGTASFGTIVFSEAGTYTYTIKESAIRYKGWSGDTSEYKLTVVVDDVDGKLSASGTVTKDGQTADAVEFTNTYKPEATTIGQMTDPDVKKTLTGVTPQVDETFTFQLKASKASNPMPTGSDNGIKVVTIDMEGQTNFGAWTYTEPGIYEYEVTEVEGDSPNFTYDSSAYLIRDVVTDDGQGQLVLVRTITKGDEEVESIEFTNVYTPLPTDAFIVPTVTKTVSVSSEDYTPEAQDFIFEIAGNDDGSAANLPKDSNDASVSSVTINTNTTGTASFGNIVFTEAGTYTYTIKESAVSYKGWSGDASEYILTVVVEDVAGKLVATSSVTKNGEVPLAIEFVNTYKPEATDSKLMVDPPVRKTVSGDKPAKDAVFTFQLRARDVNFPMPEGSFGGVKTADVIGEGETEFGTWEYTEPGTYIYDIVELNTKEKDYTYDSTVYTITDIVRDDGQGQLVHERIVTKDGDPAGDTLAFTNVYKSPVMRTVPKTGDMNWLPLYAGLLILSLVGMGMVTIKKRRK